MNVTERKGKNLIFVVPASNILFLILHSIELPFQEYPNKILLLLFRIMILAPLLYFLYLGHTWTRWIVAILSIYVVIFLVGTSIYYHNMLYGYFHVIISLMLITLLFNSYVLLFSPHIKDYIKFQKNRRTIGIQNT